MAKYGPWATSGPLCVPVLPTWCQSLITQPITKVVWLGIERVVKILLLSTSAPFPTRHPISPIPPADYTFVGLKCDFSTPPPYPNKTLWRYSGYSCGPLEEIIAHPCSKMKLGTRALNCAPSQFALNVMTIQGNWWVLSWASAHHLCACFSKTWKKMPKYYQRLEEMPACLINISVLSTWGWLENWGQYKELAAPRGDKPICP